MFSIQLEVTPYPFSHMFSWHFYHLPIFLCVLFFLLWKGSFGCWLNFVIVIIICREWSCTSYLFLFSFLFYHPLMSFWVFSLKLGVDDVNEEKWFLFLQNKGGDLANCSLWFSTFLLLFVQFLSLPYIFFKSIFRFSHFPFYISFYDLT